MITLDYEFLQLYHPCSGKHGEHILQVGICMYMSSIPKYHANLVFHLVQSFQTISSCMTTDAKYTELGSTAKTGWL